MGVDLLRTRVLLEALAGEQDRLAAELAATGLTDFADRADWLIAHRTPDEQLAWSRRWRALGIPAAEVEPVRERFARPASLAERRARKSRHPVVPEERALAVALEVFDRQSPAVQRRWAHA